MVSQLLIEFWSKNLAKKKSSDLFNHFSDHGENTPILLIGLKKKENIQEILNKFDKNV